MKSASLYSIIVLVSACTYQQKEPGAQSYVVDSAIYVGHVLPFDETKEFYTSLHALKHFQAHTSKYIESELDSVVYDDGEGTKRTRLPLDVARQHFNLSGLNRISVYNNTGDLVTDATLERVEFLEGLIENQFVAVFKPVNFVSDITYCITSPNPFTNIPVPCESFEDQNLTSKLTQRFAIDTTKVWKVQHLRFSKNKSIWSVIAVDPGSYVIETTEVGATVLFESKEDYSLMEIMPVQIEINGKPVLLCIAGVNETDMMWSMLLVYTSGWYEVMKTGRLRD